MLLPIFRSLGKVRKMNA